VAYTDGGSRGNPGPGGAGVVLADPSGAIRFAKGYYLGQTTNNAAEYTAFIKALEAARRLGADAIELVTDSQLLAKQVQGEYAVRSPGIRPLYDKVKSLLAEFACWKVTHVRRSQNKQADKLVNKAIDAGRDVDGLATSSNRPPICLGVLISGSGRTMMNLLERIKQGELNARIGLVISSRSDVPGVEKARAAGLQLCIIRRKDFPDIESFSQRLTEELTKAGVDLVVQAGWLCLWRIPEVFKNKVMNIHPALLPSFGGKGMYGIHVHQAVLAAGCKVSGCTVHFCTDQYDSGPIIIQRTCPVLDDDTPQTLAGRVFEQECIAYPEAIELFAAGRLVVEGNRVKVRPVEILV
jgi:formyltetrahydrofolate-dependent phosphoribosylglycinamide formyltransferase